MLLARAAFIKARVMGLLDLQQLCAEPLPRLMRRPCSHPQHPPWSWYLQPRNFRRALLLDL
jgi:hypothetical protein